MTDRLELERALAVPRPGAGIFILGVIFPACVIAFELSTQMCAQYFFDPIPSFGHLLAVSAAPFANGLLWARLRSDKLASGWQVLLCAAGCAVSASYTLVFLPILPLSVIAVIVYGLGLLPFAPLSALICGVILTARVNQQLKNRLAPVAGGLLAGIVALLALDAPQAITRAAVQLASGDETSMRKASSLMRMGGDRDFLLRLCYDSTGRPAGILSALASNGGLVATMFDESSFRGASTTSARSLYYHLTGDLYTSVPPPFTTGRWAFTQRFAFDEDQGGSQVGARLEGLSLASSRIDGSLDGEGAVGYVEWTLEFANSGPSPGEARATIRLPPGAVISRATLWVNGEEREAAFASKGDARAAYQQVVRRERRDPLLVTMKGADRVLVQAFPTPSQGTIKIRLGMTIPATLGKNGEAVFSEPAIVDRNFSIGSALRHSVWLEGKGALRNLPTAWVSETIPGGWRLRAQVDDRALGGQGLSVRVARAPAASMLWAPSLAVGDKPSRSVVIQEIAQSPHEAADALLFVLDGSRRGKRGRQQIEGALAHIPHGMPVGLFIAGDKPVRLSPAPWTPAVRERLRAALKNTRFIGGQDNAGALADGVVALDRFPRGALIWVHGPQPLSDDAFRLDQSLSRSGRLPQLYLFETEPGPNLLLTDQAWFWQARNAPIGAGLADIVGELASSAPRWSARRFTAPTAPAQAQQGSAHLARLWAQTQILTLASSRDEHDQAQAVALAQAYRLITPVSGAVVLETDVDYARAGLSAPGVDAVPTVPEPEEWALMFILSAAFAFMLWRERDRFALLRAMR